MCIVSMQKYNEPKSQTNLRQYHATLTTKYSKISAIIGASLSEHTLVDSMAILYTMLTSSCSVCKTAMHHVQTYVSNAGSFKVQRLLDVQ